MGEAMLALNERQRAFVRECVANPLAQGTLLAKRAGYTGTHNSVKVHAHALRHNPRVLAAIEEETRKRVRFGGLIGIAGLIKLASDPKHPYHGRACEALADRGGFAVQTQHKVTVEHRGMSATGMVEKIKQIAAELGVNPASLLGQNAPAEPEMKVIEHQPVEPEKPTTND